MASSYYATTPKEYVVRPGTLDSGKDYEIKVAAWLSLQCLARRCEHFWIAMNVKEAGDFDDVVLYRKTPEDKGMIYLVQLKHQDNPKNLTAKEFLNEKEKISIATYSKSFTKLEELFKNKSPMSDMVKQLQKVRKVFILSTNRNTCKNIPFLAKLHNAPHLSAVRNGGTIYKFDHQVLSAQNSKYPKEFIGRFFLFAEQHSIKDLDKDIENTIMEIFAFDLDQEILTTVSQGFEMFIKDWSKGKLGGYYPLTRDHILKKLTELLLKPYMLNLSETKPSNNIFSKAGIACWNNVISDKHVTVVETPNDTVVSFLEKTISSAVNSEFSNIKKVITSKDVLRVVDESNCMPFNVSYEFLWKTGRQPLLLEANDKESSQFLRRILKTCQGVFHVVIINNSDDSLIDLDVDKLFADISNLEESHRRTLMQLPIKLQGRIGKVPEDIIGPLDLIGADDFNLIRVKDIIHILCNQFSIGNTFEALPEFFVEMTLKKVWLEPEVLQKLKGEAFVIFSQSTCTFNQLLEHPKLNINKMEISSWSEIKNNPKARIILVENSECMGEIESSFKYQTIHYLIVHDGKHLQWAKTQGTTKNIKLYRKRVDPPHLNAVSLNHVVACTKRKLILVSSKPGMGKSVLLNYIGLNASTKLWVLKLNLPEYKELYKKCKNENRAENEKLFQNLINNILEKQACNDAFAKGVFGKYLDNKNILFLFDAFDEIPISYQNGAKNMIKFISGCAYRVWVTTRPVLKSELELALDTFATELNLFTREDQETLLKRYFAKAAKSLPSDKRIELFVNQLLEASKRNLNDRDNEFTGVPLQCTLLAEVFRKDCIKYFEEFAFVSKHFDLLYMYKHFIKEKTEIACQKTDGISKDMIKQYKIYRSLYALKLIFADCNLDQLNVDSKLKQANELFPHMKQLIQKDGIVVIESDCNVAFVHRSFGEYLAARWLSKNINGDYKKIAKNLIKHIFDPNFEIVRNIFDRLLARECPLHLAVINQQVDKVAQIIKDSDSSIFIQTDLGNRNFLHLIASWGFYHPKHVDKNSHYKELLSLRKMAINDDIVKILKLVPADRIENSTTDNILNYTPLDYTIASRSFFVANTICKQIENPYYFTLVEDLFSGSLLEITEILGYNHILRVILRLYSFEDFQTYIECINKDCADLTNLHDAVRQGATESILSFTDENHDINELDEDGFTPLHTAVMVGDAEIVDMLLSHGANPNKKDPSERTPLHLLCVLYVRDASRFINHDISNKCYLENTTETAPVSASSIAKVLLSHKASINVRDFKQNTPLVSTANNGNTKMAKVLLSEGSDIEAQNKFGNTALILGSRNGHVELAKLLLTEGANTETKNIHGYTALIFAARNGHLDVVTELLSHGSNVDADTNNSETPLILAASNGHIDVVNTLLSKKPNKETKNNYGNTALILAARNGYTAVANALLSEGASVEANNDCGDTALICASSNGHVDAVSALLLNNADKEAKNDYSDTAIIFAARNGHPEVINVLLTHGANVEAKNNNGDTPLIVAASNGHADVVNELLSMEPDKETRNNYGDTALIAAANNGHADVVNALLLRGSHTEAQNDNGDTALIFAARNGHIEVVDALLSCGSNIDAKDNDGNSALFWASRNGHFEIVNLLTLKADDEDFLH